MKLKTDVCLPLLFAISSLGLVGCGGGDSGGVSGDGSNGSGVIDDLGVTGPPHTLAISAPHTNAIVDIEGTGFYKRFASVMVTDIDGNPVVDGTVIRLSVIDSILARGVITDPNDSVSGSTLEDALPTEGDGDTETSFEAAVVTRNSAQRFIQSGDQVLLINAESTDKVRYVGTTAPTANVLTTTNAYSNAYPNDIYDSTSKELTTKYVVGASLLGATVKGIDSDGNDIATGQSVTSQGLARFSITYPTTALMVGCGVSYIDRRYEPLGSADLYMVASATNTVTAVSSSNICFSSIIGGTIDILSGAEISVTSGEATTVRLRMEDGGDKVRVPYSIINGSFSGEASVDFSQHEYTDIWDNVYNNPNDPDLGERVLGEGVYLTDKYGQVELEITVTGASGGKVTVTFTGNGSAVGTIAVTIL